MAQPLSVAYGLEVKRAHPLFGMVSATVPLNQRRALYRDPRVLKVARDRTVRVPDEPVKMQVSYMSFKQVSEELNLENLWEEKGRGKGSQSPSWTAELGPTLSRWRRLGAWGTTGTVTNLGMELRQRRFATELLLKPTSIA